MAAGQPKVSSRGLPYRSSLPEQITDRLSSVARLKGPARFLEYRAAFWRKRGALSSIRSADPTRRVNTWYRVFTSLRAIDANAEVRVMFGIYGAHYFSSYLTKRIAEGRTSGSRFTYMLLAGTG
jgi:hypothetical protein